MKRGLLVLGSIVLVLVIAVWAQNNTAPVGNLAPTIAAMVGGTDGTNLVAFRAASAANLGASFGTGAQIIENGPRWSVNSAPAAGSQGTSSKAAGGAGVRHVVDKVCFSGGSTTAPALTQLTVNIRDGATGAGTILASFQTIVIATAGQNVAPYCTPSLNLIGTANTAMTAEWSASLANEFEQVSITGFDLQ